MKTINLSCKMRNIALMSVIFSLIGCGSLQYFDEQVYTQTTAANIDALMIMDLATENYNVHEESVKEFQARLQKIFDYEKNRVHNEITIKLWNKLLDKDGQLLGGFLNRWSTEQTLNATYINEAKKLVDKAFYQIADLEGNKKHLKDQNINLQIE
jgi:hypothetical protein